MKLGIRSIHHVPVAGCTDYSVLAPGSKINLASFTQATPAKLPFTPETADLREDWRYDAGGRSSLVTFAAEIRADREQYRSALNSLTGRSHLFVVETIDGAKYIIGSPRFPATFTWSDSVSGISKSAFAIKIECKSLHGALFSA